MLKKINITALFFFFIVSVFAQTGGSIKTSVSKNKILIGEPLELTIETYLPSGLTNKETIVDTIPHFEFLKKPVTDTTGEGQELRIKSVYRITSFDSGHWVIPSFVLSGKIKSDTIGIDVVFSDFDPEQDYHDIKGIIETEPPEKNKQWWYIVGGVLLLSAALYFFLRKKKPAAVSVAYEKPVDAYAEAMHSLEELRVGNFSVKAYFTRLTDIFRLYVFRKKGIQSLQRTTDDLVMQLKNAGFKKDEFDRLSSSLRLADFVKFAKYNASDDDKAISFSNVLAAIKSIEAKTNTDLEKEIKPDA